MREETIKLYKINELKENIQEEVIEKYRYININYEWYLPLFEDFKERLKAIGITCETFYFDFERENYIMMEKAEVINKNLFLEKAGYGKEILLNELEENKIYFDVYIGKSRYENYVNIEVYHEEENKENKYFDIDEDALTEFLNNILKEFLKELKKEYNYLISDEAVKEKLEINEYEFLEDGRIY